MRINIVCYEETNSWILGKFALKLRDELSKINGVYCELSSKALDGFDITHHIIYLGDFKANDSINTCMVTHIDSVAKINRIKELIRNDVHCICMSNDTIAIMLNCGLRHTHLHYIWPAHDSDVGIRKINLLITSRTYPDDRKNQHFLNDIFSRIDIDCFKLTIMGSGWEDVIRKLPKALDINYYPKFEINIYKKLFSQSDYYLYMGFDEGSIGYLDALQAGITPIVSLQGFHKDIYCDSALYFNKLSEVRQILCELSKKHVSMRALVRDLSWERYAHNHYSLWKSLLTKKDGIAQETSRASGLVHRHVHHKVFLLLFIFKIYAQKGQNYFKRIFQ